MTDLGVDHVTKTAVPWLLVVGVAISRRPPATHCSSKAMSSVLRDFGIGSYMMGSTVPIGAAGSSSWAGGVATKAGVGF